MNRGSLVGGDSRFCFFRIGLREGGHGVGDGSGSHGSAMGKMAAAELESPGNVGKIEIGICAEMLFKIAA